MHCEQSSVGKRLGEAGHLAADRRLALDQHHFVAGVGDVERRLDAGHAAADHQRPLRHGTRIGSSARLRRTLATDMRIRSIALAVACSRSWCTHEQCSRMLAISTR